MSPLSKIVSLAAALLVFVGGVSLAGPPDPTKPQVMPAPFWITQPTQNQKILARTKFDVKLKATNPPPPGVYLEWQRKNTTWQPQFGPTGMGWGGTSLELVIPVAEGFFWDPGYFRVRAYWGSKYSPWVNFQIIKLQPIPQGPIPLPSR